MGSRPRSEKVSWLGSSVVVALMAACGSAPTSPSGSAPAQASPTPSPASATPTLPPPPPPIAPFIGVATSSNAESLYSATGTRTAAFPDNYNPVSPLGNRLLAEHQSALVNGRYGVDALVAMTASGAVTELETIADPADFIDAIGSEDGT